MIITRCQKIKTQDPARFAWSRISQFQNLEHTTDVICRLHLLEKSQLANARNQAEQIKYCLTQAKEYVSAAAGVTLATKPVLLYYSIMSLALAEILLKQSGQSRLPRLREAHNCHGLQLVSHHLPKADEALSLAASALKAKVQVDPAGNPKGTFEVWRRSAREYPTGGYRTISYPNRGTQKGFTILFYPEDIAPPVPFDGVSLYECFANLPYMEDVLRRLGGSLDMVRATVSLDIADDTQNQMLTVVIHPAEQTCIDRFNDLVVCEPSGVDHIHVDELPSGYFLRLDQSKPNVRSFPHSICLSDDETFFSCNRRNLGEFGFLYVALHICGNFARYYPDIWLKHIEKSSPLCLAIDELCAYAFERLPLLTLSELHRSYYVHER